MTIKSKTPQIRFKGFSGEWEEKELIDICNFINENILLSKLASDKYISTENLLQDFLGVILSSKLPNLKNVTHFKKNDILISNIRPYLKKVWSATFDGGASNDVIVVRANGNINNNYLTHLIKSEKFINYVMDGAKGVKMPRGDISLIKKYPLVISSKVAEQTKIGNYFQHLDKLIEQKEKKYQKLGQFKKAMLSKMFPKNGAATPEIRFNGFSGEWEEKSLGELSEYKNGKGHEDKQKTFGKYELINLNSISIDGGLKHSGKFVDETDTTLNRNDLVMVLSDVGHGDLLGRVALIPKDNKFVLNQRVGLLRPSSAIFPLFLFYNINANQKYFKLQGAGMSQLNISKSSVENFTSHIPSDLIEQTKIGNYFQKLDKLIDLHHQELQKLKNIKKASLTKMFV